MLWIDVTDLVEFIAGGSTVSGVQRVEAQLAPLLLAQDSQAVILDRSRGVFIALTAQETTELVVDGVSGGIATASGRAQIAIERASHAEPASLSGEADAVLLVLGAAWINDQLMAAIRAAAALGVRVVDLFYDLTPVLDAGHSSELRPLFERYLAMLSDVGARVPAISQSSRTDLTQYLHEKGWRVPQGSSTGLPSGLIGPDRGRVDTSPADTSPAGASPPNEKFALMVGTIEARKNHQLAFDAWQELIRRHGSTAVPTLICVGKVGWNSEQFLDNMDATSGLEGKIQLRTDSVSDAELAQLYRDCEFTVYPSEYEGWGLPVTESLYFGAPAVVARNSSLTEAGGDLACYFTSGDVHDFINVIDSTMLNESRRLEIKQQIRQRINAEFGEPITWESVAAQLKQELEQAGAEPRPEPVVPELVAWQTLPFGSPHTEFTDRLVTGNQRPPQPWGIPLFLGQQLSFSFTHHQHEHLTLHMGTLNEPGRVTIEINGAELVFSRGEIVSVTLGMQQPNVPITVTVRALDVGPSDSGFIGLTSIMIEGETAMSSENAMNHAVEKLQAENQALRTDITQLTSELEQTRAELERKSQSLLSRASKRLSRPANG